MTPPLRQSKNLPSVSYADLSEPEFAYLQNMGIKRFPCKAGLTKVDFVSLLSGKYE